MKTLASLREWFREVGPDDPVFDALLVLGPLVIAAAAVAGRTLFTLGVAVGYLVSLVVYVGYLGVTRD